MLPVQVLLLLLLLLLLQHLHLWHVRSGRDADANCLRGDDNASDTGESWGRLVLRQTDVVSVHKAGEEQEHLHARQSVPQAAPSSHSEWHKEVGTVHVAIGTDEALRVEILGLVPQSGVHVHALDQGNDLSSGGNGKAVHLHISKAGRGRTRITKKSLVRIWNYTNVDFEEYRYSAVAELQSLGVATLQVEGFV